MGIRMTKPKNASRPHSTEYFGTERDFFWNADFLDLLARRLDLPTISLDCRPRLLTLPGYERWKVTQPAYRFLIAPLTW